MNNELGEFLEKLRGKMSLRTASEKSGLSHSYIRDLELGVNRVTKTPIRPTPESLKKLSEAYNYSYEELMKKAGYIEDKNKEESEHSLPESVYEHIIKETEEKYGITLRDDPFVVETMKQIIDNYAKSKIKNNQ